MYVSHQLTSIDCRQQDTEPDDQVSGQQANDANVLHSSRLIAYFKIAPTQCVRPQCRCTERVDTQTNCVDTFPLQMGGGESVSKRQVCYVRLARQGV